MERCGGLRPKDPPKYAPKLIGGPDASDLVELFFGGLPVDGEHVVPLTLVRESHVDRHGVYGRPYLCTLWQSGPPDRLSTDEVRQVCCVLKRNLARFFNDLGLLARGEVVLSSGSCRQQCRQNDSRCYSHRRE